LRKRKKEGDHLKGVTVKEIKILACEILNQETQRLGTQSGKGDHLLKALPKRTVSVSGRGKKGAVE